MTVAVKRKNITGAPSNDREKIKLVYKQDNYKSYFKSPIGYIEIIATDNSLVSLDFIDKAPKNTSVSPAYSEEVSKQLAEYFNGKRKEFSLNIKPEGTDFQKNVWKELVEIPYGTTMSYKDVAHLIKNDKAVRAVGNANNKNKVPILIPCHRVIGSDGNLTGYAGGLWRKEWLIKHEKQAV